MPSLRSALVVAVALAVSAPASGQITWSVLFDDPAGVGFNDPTVPAGETLTAGQLRRNSVTAAADYLSTVFDGRGTVNVSLSSVFTGGPLAKFDVAFPQVSNINGSFENSGPFQAAVTGTRPSGGAAGLDATGVIDFTFGYNYAGQVNAPNAAAFDLTSVALREFVHASGFASKIVDGSGVGQNLQPLGTSDAYSAFDRYLQRGSDPLATRLFQTDITSDTFAAFTGDPATLTNGNGTADGLFFGGDLSREVNQRYLGGVVPLNAPAVFADRVSVARVADPAGLMSPDVAPNEVKRLRAYEIAMLMDLGWNGYLWDGTDGNWLDGADGPPDLSRSRWRTEQGITWDGVQGYNTNSAQDPARVLPPHAQVTANVVLEFRANGGAGFTATNNIGTVRLSRLKVNNASAAPVTLAGGTLDFGRNADGSASVLVPRIEQYSSGPLVITSDIRVNQIADATLGGVLFLGHDKLQVGGPGSGPVTISGNISGSGGLQTFGGFTTTLTGTNSYARMTEVNSGTLLVNGDNSAATDVTLVYAGTLGGTGIVGGNVEAWAGTIAPGPAAGIGTLTVNGSVTVQGGGTLQTRLGAGTTADRLDLTSGSNSLQLWSRNPEFEEPGATVALVNGGFTAAEPTTFLIADLEGPAASLFFVGVTGFDTLPAGSDITVFRSAGGDAGTVTKVNGAVNLTLSGFNLRAGDKLTLRRDAAGDLVVVFTPVPEPATVLGVCAAVAGGGMLWRRRRKSVGRPSTCVDRATTTYRGGGKNWRAQSASAGEKGGSGGAV